MAGGLNNSTLTIGDKEKAAIESVLQKIGQYRQQDDRVTVIKLREFGHLLNKDEIKLIEQVRAINPRSYGFMAPRVGSESTPSDLVRIEPQKYVYNGEENYTRAQYLPSHVHTAYLAMAEAMQIELGRPLLIESSYRSDLYQIITFLSILKTNQFDIAKTAKRVAIPGYSEHSTPSKLALDLKNIDGLPSDETPQDFEGTLEYNWLLVHASKFNFYMSYPKNNPYGVMFEPWHWRHIPKKS